MNSQLFDALSTLLPKAKICLMSERPWHSLTFSGKQSEWVAVVAGENHLETARDFGRILTDHDFHLDGELVADIAVTRQEASHDHSSLVIHALLLGA